MRQLYAATASSIGPLSLLTRMRKL